MTHEGRRRAILAIDTATTQVVIASGSPAGVIDGLSTWTAGHRHGQHLLASIGRFLSEQNIRRSRLAGIVVGTGPGAFTGMRVGIATAKGLAHGLGLPLVGSSTTDALIRAAAEAASLEPSRLVLLVPAGPSDRIAARLGQLPRLLPGGTEPDLAAADRLVALDLPGRAPDAALELGEVARRGLGAALIRDGADRLATIEDRTGELAELVPSYVTLPRGVARLGGTVTWSHAPR